MAESVDRGGVHTAPAFQAPAVGSRAPRLVIVEDDEDLVSLIGFMVAPSGWEVVSAQTAARGMLAIDTADPDVVLLDLGLPDASGIDVLDALQAEPRTAWIPVVVLSGDHQPASVRSALLSGAQDFVTKPFVAEELQARLLAALRVASAHRALAEAELRFRLTFEEAPIGIALLSPAGEWLWVNRAMCSILGREESELLTLTFQDLTHPDDLDADLGLVERLLCGEIDRYRMEKRYLHADGHIVWAELSVSLVRDELGQPRHFVSQVQDITTLHDARELLRHQSLHDALTGLPNRVLLYDRLRQALAQESRRRTGLAVLFLDLDGLKAVNDALGHDVGDVLLVQIARRLQDAVRDGDTVARLGGDEFVILGAAIDDLDAAGELADRVRAAMGRPFDLDSGPVACTASIGLALPRPGQTPEAILREADRAMYRAKERGKDQWVLADESLWVDDGVEPPSAGRTW